MVELSEPEVEPSAVSNMARLFFLLSIGGAFFLVTTSRVVTFSVVFFFFFFFFFFFYFFSSFSDAPFALIRVSLSAAVTIDSVIDWIRHLGRALMANEAPKGFGR